MRLIRPVAAILPLLALGLYGQTYPQPAYNNQGYSYPVKPPQPATAGDLARVALGKKLFFDKRLSSDSTVSCSSCHDPEHAFADVRVLSAGVFARPGTRHSPSLVGRGAGTLQFWDGRSANLEAQVIEPIRNPAEMDTTVDAAVSRLRSDPAYSTLTGEALVQAPASYVRTIRSVESPFDHFLNGGEPGLTATEREGLRLFRDKARCYICHSGDNLTDEVFHNTGVAWKDGRLQDEGRAAITHKAYEKGAFKTPTLREVAKTAPYMHDGSLATLEDVLEFYDRGGNPNPYLDANLQPLHLTKAEKDAVLAFLRALTGSVRDGL